MNILSYLSTYYAIKQQNKFCISTFFSLKFLFETFLLTTVTTKKVQEYLRVKQPCMLNSARCSYN